MHESSRLVPISCYLSCLRVIKKVEEILRNFHFIAIARRGGEVKRFRVVCIYILDWIVGSRERNYMRIFYDFQFSWHRCFMICEIHYFPPFQPAQRNIHFALRACRRRLCCHTSSDNDDCWSFSIQCDSTLAWGKNVIESENLCDGVCLMIYEGKDKYKIEAITRQWWQSGSGNVAGNGNKFPDFERVWEGGQKRTWEVNSETRDEWHDEKSKNIYTAEKDGFVFSLRFVDKLKD